MEYSNGEKVRVLTAILYIIENKYKTFICSAFDEVEGMRLTPQLFEHLFPELYNGIMEVGRKNYGADYGIGEPFIPYSFNDSNRTGWEFRIDFLKELLEKFAQ